MPWMKTRSFMIMGDLYDPTSNELYKYAPRSILKKQISELTNISKYKLIQDYNLQGASELEFFLFEKKYSENLKNGLKNNEFYGSQVEDYLILQGDRYEHIMEKFRSCLSKSGIVVESSKGEASIGQHEINITYSEVLDMSDKILALKMCLKQIAEDNNTSVTFMAKPSIESLGSSSHIHVSLLNLEKQNVFKGDDHQLTENLNCSNTMYHFLGGMMKHSLETFVCFAPLVNSYKRYKNFSWAPSNLGTWSVDNRTSPFRIVGSGQNLRIEYRIPGGDVNQYICYTAMIASGINGIKQRIEPPKIQKGCSYSINEIVRPPSDLYSAVKLFRDSEFIKQVLGEDVHKHYTNFYMNEAMIFENVITEWELKRYFDII